MSKIRFGVHLDACPEMLVDSDYAAIKKIALQSESLNYYSLWVMDHLTEGENNEGAMFEAWTLLSALSIETKKIRLGTMVTCDSFRNPGLTAKIGATLDVISNGRLILGYGAGWKEDEFIAYGFPFPKPSIRIKKMREGIIVVKKLWTEKRASFKGDVYNIEDAICNPKPIQKPHPLIIVGGEGERFLLRAAAEVGDGWNIFGASIEDYKRKVDILTKYCDAFGRRIEDIELSWAGDMILGEDEKEVQRKISKHKPKKGIFCTYDECIEILQRYIDLGCSHFIFALKSFNEEKENFVERVNPSF